MMKRQKEIIEILCDDRELKTRFCMEYVARLLDLYWKHKSLETKILWIDCGGQFDTENQKELLKTIVNEKECIDELLETDVNEKECIDELLENIHIISVGTSLQFKNVLDKIVENLASFEESEENDFLVHTKLIVIDSIVHILAPIIGTGIPGVNVIEEISKQLHQISDHLNNKILITNSIISMDRVNHLPKPALGSSWATAIQCETRLYLSSKEISKSIHEQRLKNNTPEQKQQQNHFTRYLPPFRICEKALILHSHSQTPGAFYQFDYQV